MIFYLRSTSGAEFFGVGVAASDTVITLSRFNDSQERSIASTNSTAGTPDIKLTTLILERHVVGSRVEQTSDLNIISSSVMNKVS